VLLVVLAVEVAVLALVVLVAGLMLLAAQPLLLIVVLAVAVRLVMLILPQMLVVRVRQVWSSCDTQIFTQLLSAQDLLAQNHLLRVDTNGQRLLLVRGM
jgi:hypothetical protein